MIKVPEFDGKPGVLDGGAKGSGMAEAEKLAGLVGPLLDSLILTVGVDAAWVMSADNWMVSVGCWLGGRGWCKSDPGDAATFGFPDGDATALVSGLGCVGVSVPMCVSV